MNKPAVDPQDIEKVKSYMYQHCCGYKNGKNRQEISQALDMPDRYFRMVCSQIDEVITSIHYGYYLLPLVDSTGAETKAARDVLDHEDRRRIIALYLRHRRQRQAVKRMQGKEMQKEFSYAA